MRIACSVALALLGGCVLHVGQRLDDVAVATSPGGTDVTVHLEGTATPLAGELLAARDTALVLRSDRGIVLVRYANVARADVSRGRTPMRLDHLAPPSDSTLQQLRLLSRYPQGISDELMARLLAQTGQPTLVVVGQ